MKCPQTPDDPPLVFGKTLDKGGSSGMNPSDRFEANSKEK